MSERINTRMYAVEPPSLQVAAYRAAPDAGLVELLARNHSVLRFRELHHHREPVWLVFCTI